MTEAEWLTCTDPDAMLEWLMNCPTGIASSARYRTDPPYPSDRKLRLFACAVCRSKWPLLTDERSCRAVEIAERFADGMATEEELHAAWAAALDAVNTVPWEAAWDAVWAARASFIAAHTAARKDRAAILRDHFAPFHRTPFDPVWRTPTVLALAQAAYEQPMDVECGDIIHHAMLGGLPYLADALEDAGCTDDVLLRHLRVSAPCRRGCWAVDRLLGKE